MSVVCCEVEVCAMDVCCECCVLSGRGLCCGCLSVVSVVCCQVEVCAMDVCLL